MALTWPATLIGMLLAAGPALAYPDVWQGYAGSTCAHPDGAHQFSGHEGAIVNATSTTAFVISEVGGGVTSKMCPGKAYAVKVDLPRISAREDPHLYLTSSAGAFGAVQGDKVEACSDGGTKRVTTFAAPSYTTTLALKCSDRTGVRLFATFAVRSGVFYQASLTVPVDGACAAASCASGAGPNPSPSPWRSPSPSPSPAPSPPPAPSPSAGAASGCKLPCSCAFGVEFGESVCGYANTTADVKAFQDALSLLEPNWSEAQAIYSQGRFSYRDDGVTKRTMYAVAHRNYSQEAYYKLSAAYHKREFYVDDFVGTALRGEGDYAGACCGVRAEVAKAGARWFSAAYAIHEVDAGMCYATGCNAKAINLPLAGEEILHGMALMSGADSDAQPSGPAGTSNPANLFQATDAASTHFCTQKKAGGSNKKAPPTSRPLAAINQATIDAHKAMSAAAAKGDVAAINAKYADVERAFVARFLQYSLRDAYEASRPASKSALKNAGACRSPCLRQAQQAAARTYFRAAEPIAARAAADQVAAANAVLGAAPSPKSYKQLAAAYKAILSAIGADPRAMLAKCKA